MGLLMFELLHEHEGGDRLQLVKLMSFQSYEVGRYFIVVFFVSVIPQQEIAFSHRERMIMVCGSGS